MKTPLPSRLLPLLVLALLAVAPAHGQITQRWLTQWGSSGNEYGDEAAVDGAGTMWVTGYTTGALGGPNAGSNDLFLTPLSATGVPGTSRQRGAAGEDRGYAVAVVGGSTIFSVGLTNSTIWDGAPVIGGYDALAVSYSAAGTWQSTTRFGSTGTDQANKADGNATHLLVAGNANGAIDGQAQVGGQDAFLSKRTSTGALVWTRVVGSSGGETGLGAAFDNAGNAYLAGYTSGSLPTFTTAGGTDLFVARYDSSGTQTLLRQWGSSASDQAYDMKVDGSGNIYLTGLTSGALGGQANSGVFDAFLTKLDSSGTVLWTRLLGGTGFDTSNTLALDTGGNVWIGGVSFSPVMAGHTNAGNQDAFVARYDSAGNLLSTFFWGTSVDDQLTGLAAAPDGSVSVCGFTNGTLGAASAGGYDAWAASLTAVPEPSAALLLAASAGLLLLRRRG